MILNRQNSITCHKHKYIYLMQESLMALLRCPVSKSALQLQVISRSLKKYNGVDQEIIEEGILFAREDWFYPIIQGIPRLIVEAYADYEPFLRKHLPDYPSRRQQLENKYHALTRYVIKKNRRTKKSFEQEWNLYNYDKDKTWDAAPAGMFQRFLDEIAETREALPQYLIFDAGCGNGLLNQLIAQQGATVLGMDFSLSIEQAYLRNTEAKALFIQGDVQFPPVAFEQFDIVHCSGVLIHTNNPELSFSCLDPHVKPGGKLSVWLYHPRKDFIHNLFNGIRRFTSRLPLRLQFYLYAVTLLPVSFIIKRIKGNKQNGREMMIDILDWFTPEFRHQFEQAEAATWFYKRRYSSVTTTTTSLFGYNMIGIKQKPGSTIS